VRKSYESVENYLETILILSERLTNVRAIDIANELSFSRASVSISLKKLLKSNYILVDENSFITLTGAGREIAENIHNRHTILAKFLTKLGVDETVASDDACKIEHIISEESFIKIREFIAEN